MKFDCIKDNNMKKLIAILTLSLIATLSHADWTADGWVGAVNDQWTSFGTLPRLKSLIETAEFKNSETNLVRRFHILSTYYGSNGEDTNHTIRTMLIGFLPTDRVDVQQFRTLTGNGDAKRVTLAINSTLRYGQEMFIERNLSESMRINALFVLFLSFGSTENLNLADTTYSSDVFQPTGGSLMLMRTTRKRLVEAATLWNKQKLAAEGKSFVGPGKLLEVNNLVNAINSGTNWVESLQALNVAIDSNAVNQVRTLANQIKSDIAAGGVVNQPRRTLLEIYLGTQGYNNFFNNEYGK